MEMQGLQWTAMDLNSHGLQWIVIDLHGHAWRGLDCTAPAWCHMDLPGNSPNSESDAMCGSVPPHTQYTIQYHYSGYRL